MENEILIAETKLDDFDRGTTASLIQCDNDTGQVTLQDMDWQQVGDEQFYDTLVFSNERIVALRDFLNLAIDILEMKGIL